MRHTTTLPLYRKHRNNPPQIIGFAEYTIDDDGIAGNQTGRILTPGYTDSRPEVAHGASARRVGRLATNRKHELRRKAAKRSDRTVTTK